MLDPAKVKQAQAYLKTQGFDLGASGENHDGIDGDPGGRTLAALIDFTLKSAGGGTAVAAAPTGSASGPIALISADLLHVGCPERSTVELAPWVEPVKAACVRFEINTVRRVAAFIAQIAHESGFQARSENLNYRAERLCEVWPNRFPNIGVASQYAHNPERLANKVYGGRMGNGDEASGDGWRFRGVGPLQVTGRANMTAFAAAIGKSVDDALAYAQTLEGGIMAAAWFWEDNDINRLADTPGVGDETRRINGGENGLADRTARFNELVAALLKAGA